jgi:hypothetical protein
MGDQGLDVVEEVRRRGEFVEAYQYCAARLQTLDRGARVSPYTVREEMGHGSLAMVEKVYAHLGQVRARTEVLEYRVEQHLRLLENRLATFQG